MEWWWCCIGNKFQVIGLTGGIATGKSTVSSMLEEAGINVIDADKLSKQVSTEPGTLKSIKSSFGDEVFNEDGSLDRDKLGDIGKHIVKICHYFTTI